MTPAPPAVPAGIAGMVECARLEWSVTDSDDLAVLLEEFLSGYGLLVRDLSGGGATRAGAARRGDVVGAAVLVGAAAAARMGGGAIGAPSPAPEVPDVVAVVYTAAEPGVLALEAHRGGAAGGSPVAGAALPGTAATGGNTREAAGALPLGAAPPYAGAIVSDAEPGGAAGPAGGCRIGDWTPSWTDADHAAAVRAVRDEIAAGEVYQVNVVGHRSAPYNGDPSGPLAAVASLPGAAYGGVLTSRTTGAWAVASASPETLVVVADGVARTRPVKGTRPATAAGRRELLASAKERAEHIMIVDLERNDLGRLAVPGTVRVESLFGLRDWSGLWQAESTVAARLRPGTGLADLLRALLPGGSVTGAPKLAAVRIAAGLEPVGRGPSMGAFGFVTHDRVDLGLTIRTVAAAGGRLHLWAGGGVTWGSDPAAEVAEAHAKAAPILRALARG